MIAKGNAFTSIALAALVVSVTVGKPAVAETLLDQYTVKSMGIAQVGGAGKCLVVVVVNSGDAGADETRFVADNSGAIKLYGSIGAVEALIKSCNVVSATVFNIKREATAETLATPTNELKAIHKAAVKELASSTVTFNKQEVERVAAVGVNWDTAAVGSLKRSTYDDMLLVLASVNEVKTKAAARVTTYAALLTAAGINPATYLPIAAATGA